jgi:hypothetical protein
MLASLSGLPEVSATSATTVNHKSRNGLNGLGLRITLIRLIQYRNPVNIARSMVSRYERRYSK